MWVWTENLEEFNLYFKNELMDIKAESYELSSEEESNNEIKFDLTTNYEATTQMDRFIEYLKKTNQMSPDS